MSCQYHVHRMELKVLREKRGSHSQGGGCAPSLDVICSFQRCEPASGEVNVEV